MLEENFIHGPNNSFQRVGVEPIISRIFEDRRDRDRASRRAAFALQVTKRLPIDEKPGVDFWRVLDMSRRRETAFLISRDNRLGNLVVPDP